MDSAPKNLGDLEALQAEAAEFAKTLSPNTEFATLVTLSGELGAGKTSFTQGLARALGITESITSPTFVLEKIYELPKKAAQGFERLIHIDAYRLEEAPMLNPLGFHEFMRDPKNLIVLEWPEHVYEAVRTAQYQIKLAVGEGNTRDIIYA
ncbi:MAG: tRNA threonylcarbamoyl adenosine modification protein YjeE [Parcubacteria bacterium C7867-008]|nr:MAG: tRNA threonylcarbamoyl adenosine modification protein YjeE [Parcubacteria bacterium C7867-008]